MKLLLMRHGEAELNAQTDADRPLTLYGRTQVSAVARRLLEMDLQVQKMMVSPYLRARQTAAIMSNTMLSNMSGTIFAKSSGGPVSNKESGNISGNVSITSAGEPWPEEVSEAITPEQSPERAAVAIAKCFDNAGIGLVIMHQPIISRLVYSLTGQDQSIGTANLAIIEAPLIGLGCCELKCVI
jgi:phosphohistidine phosphatase SixA